MKQKDIITVIISFLVIVGAVVFMMGGFEKPKSQDIPKVQEKVDFTGNIDEGAIDKLKQRGDYGTALPGNYGRSNPFAKL